MKISNPILFNKALTLLFAFLFIGPVLLLVQLPVWAHTSLVILLWLAVASYIIELWTVSK